MVYQGFNIHFGKPRGVGFLYVLEADLWGMRASTGAHGTDGSKNEEVMISMIPSGNLTQLWKITIFHGQAHKLSMAIFHSKLLVITRRYCISHPNQELQQNYIVYYMLQYIITRG